VQNLEKNKLLLLPFFIGLILMIYSWYLSYPLSINSPDDFVFNHVSILYWFSLPLLLASMLMIAITFKNDYLKLIMTVGIVMTMYSLSYFYYMLPTSDSLYYRGLNEYFIKTNNLDFSQSGKSYFQWPSIFVLSNIATSVSGLELANFEFIIYAIIGFILLLIGTSVGGWLVTIGVLILLIGIVIAWKAKGIYHVKITSASGESDAFSSNDREYIQRIVQAMNEALISRG